ncbi:putative polysaccharide biosynthesis protein [Furfurilactobacillus cerevisiae]|uniref:putative polysaccharide biosynthesis protein n=1 Tax=Furfurilactobacillus rossiae TaxID=231049 RepID=UPI003B980DBE
MSKEDPQNENSQAIPTRKQYRRRQRREALLSKLHLQGSQSEASSMAESTATVSSQNESVTASTTSHIADSELVADSTAAVSNITQLKSSAQGRHVTDSAQSEIAEESTSVTPEEEAKPQSHAQSETELEREVEEEEKPLHLVSSRWAAYPDSTAESAMTSADEEAAIKRSAEADPSQTVPLERTIPVTHEEATSGEPRNDNSDSEDLGEIVERPGFESGAVSDQEQILRGTGWMTAASITSRVLGALYIIPWVAWFGTFYNQANALFSKGYNVYSIVLMISTAGIPAAISKLIAHYNALNEYGVGYRLFKRGLLLSLVTGLVAAILLWFMAPTQSLTTGDPNVIPVLRSLTLAVFVFPTLSMMRGMFQGYHMMAPSAISQFVEQVVRVIYMLLTAYLIMQVGSAPAHNWPRAVVQSTFAAGLGAVAGIAVLIYEMWRHRQYFHNKIENAKGGLVITTGQLLKQIIWQAIPFTIVPSAIAIYQLFDQVTFFRIMHVTSNLSYAVQNTLYAYFDFNANKIIMITVSLASALAATAIPMLTEAHTLKDSASTSRQINFTLELFSFIMIPSALGMAAISVPLYTFFYHYSLAGSLILEFSSYLSVLFGLFTVLSTVMQGVDQNKAVIWYMVVGLIVKMVLQFPLVALAQPLGPLAATLIGFTVSSVLILRNLNRHFDIDWDGLLHRLNQIIVFSLVTYIVARLSVWGIDHVMDTQFKVTAFIELLISVILGGGAYAYLSLRFRLADKMLGSRVERIRTRFHIK